MSKQEELFSLEESNQWFRRNLSTVLERQFSEDKIYQLVKRYLSSNIEDKIIIELGCSNGYRLNWIKSNLNAKVFGIEPSSEAIADGINRYGFSEDELIISTTRQFFIENKNKFDCIIFGSSLSPIDPVSYADIVSGVMKSLVDDGIIIICDFHSYPQRQSYAHREGIFIYKMMFEKLFTWHPQYKVIHQEVSSHGTNNVVGNPKEDFAVTIIKKVDKMLAFPELVGDVELKK